jgi:hypothetical protein
MSSDCKACVDNRSKTIEQQIWLGKMTVIEGAKAFGMSYEDYWTHLKQHRQDVEKVDVENLNALLRYLSRHLKQRVDMLLAQPVNPLMERGISTQARLLKDIVMDIARLENQIQTTPQIQIQQFIVQQTELTSFLLSELCPICKKKVMSFLEVKEIAQKSSVST